MMEVFELNLDLKRNIAFVLDAIFEIGVGITILYINSSDLTFFYFGIGLVIEGIIQLIRKLKTFHLTESELTIKRPLFPFKIVERNFAVGKIEKIKFNNIKGRFGGPHLNVLSKESNGDFRIQTSKKVIDRFEIELNKLGIETERIGM